jgi:hypothetical protein
MSAADLLGKLEKVKPSSRGNWIACCPAHPDKNPSLTVAEFDDGRVLVHCFAGCSVENVLDAVGLEFDALFPPRPITNTHADPRRLKFDPRNVLEAAQGELAIAAILAGDVSRGTALGEADRERLMLAVERIAQARSFASGR